MTNRNDTNTDGAAAMEPGAAGSFINTSAGKTASNAIEIPSIALPKGGGAIRGMDEKLSVNPSNGTAAFSLPLPFAAARGAQPSLSLSYDSAGGNSVFGLGFSLRLPSLRRKTGQVLPQYHDGVESDIFLLADAEDLVPAFKKQPDGSLSLDPSGDYLPDETDSPDGRYRIKRYLPRIEGLFSRIERWTARDGSGTGWRVCSKDNTTSLLGWTAASRVADPADPSRVFEWKPEFIFDDKGNSAHYRYKKEDATGLDLTLLHNRNRLGPAGISYTNLYLERILYGNKAPFLALGDAFPLEGDYLFSVLLDYGEYNPAGPYNKIKEWDYREDAFSDYKPGFEIRTTRLCKRILFFHHFRGEGEYDGLVKSIDFSYDTAAERDFSFLSAITQRGYIRQDNDNYTSKSLPPLVFSYQAHAWNRQLKTLAPEQLANAPTGFDGQDYQLTDLFNEGLPGILSEQANGWYYKSNLGQGQFSPPQLVSPRPGFRGRNEWQLGDLDGDGGKQLYSYGHGIAGFFELEENNDWQGHRPFAQLPNIDFKDPDTRLIDLDGDGRADLLLAGDNVFGWYASGGRQGFGPLRQVLHSFEEEQGPRLVFNDEKQSLFMADMSGDGLTDLVRIRNGEIAYWPNLGYGKFGSKRGMDHAPYFDFPDAFDPALVKLADLDGSGTTDIVYLGKNKYSCWLNLSGNGFVQTPFEIDPFPAIHPQATVSVADLLGNGVACIVWSSSLSRDQSLPLQYIDLMDSKKPHLLVGYSNSMGKEIDIEYTPSTRFYILDKLAGKPWATKLHFPVQTISKLVSTDRITGQRMVSTYSYRHGYYDHPEREFRGFGRVDQTDAESLDRFASTGPGTMANHPLDQEPVITKTWFHTGAFLRAGTLLEAYEKEYWYREWEARGLPPVTHEFILPESRLLLAPGLDPGLLGSLSAIELRQAARACKGNLLRTENFAHDAARNGNTPDAIKKELTPYTVSMANCLLELIQPKGKNRYAVFAVKQSESLAYQYDRDAADPRISQQLNLSLDNYANVPESVSIAYPRRGTDPALPPAVQAAQAATRVLFTSTRFTNDVISFTDYRLRLPADSRVFELRNVAKTGELYRPADFETILTDARSILLAYEDISAPIVPGMAQRRMVEHRATLYYANTLTGALPQFQLESLGLVHAAYQLAFTPSLLENIFSARVPLPADRQFLAGIAGYTSLEGDGNYWVPSGTTHYIQGPETRADARNRFYRPEAFTDAWGAITHTRYYGSYSLLIDTITDALGNSSRVQRFNFRTLSPRRVSDINNNITETLVDELGMVKAMALLGKGNEADDLSGLEEASLPAETNLINAFFTLPLTPDGVTDSSSLHTLAGQLLGHATARYVYDLDAYRLRAAPAVTAAILREAHFTQDNNSPLQLSFEYTNGSGQLLMKKIQARPGPAKKITVLGDTSYTVITVDTSALAQPQIRWIGSGKTILNNKGKAVQQYEPYFSVLNSFESSPALVETGVSPERYYDAPGRLVKTVAPDSSFSSSLFSPWQQTMADANDNILLSPWYTRRFNRLMDAELLAEGRDPTKEKQAAEKAALHADTPTVYHFDSMGRQVLQVNHNINTSTLVHELFFTLLDIDIEGNLRRLTDARGNTVVQYRYDMLGNTAWQQHMDSGQRWGLDSITGKPIRKWDERNHTLQFAYDILQRPLTMLVAGGDGALPLGNTVERSFYGESLLLPNRSNEAALQALNILGKITRFYDTAGLVASPSYDFKGNPVKTERSLFRNYKGLANWTDPALAADLEPRVFRFSTETDALGRIRRQEAPDGSMITPGYNETGLLNSESVLSPGPDPVQVYIRDIDYNEKGQRNKIVYGNNTVTRYRYDRQRFRLLSLTSTRQNNDPLQDWHYTNDPSGNITHIEDRNIPLVFFNNQQVSGVTEYTYDALYRIVEARGRENDAALGSDPRDNWRDAPFMHALNPGDPVALRTYTQSYAYDAVGNMLQMKHLSTGNNWTRDYHYVPGTNRLLDTQVGLQSYPCSHHPAHGFITKLPQLDQLGWNYRDELVMTAQQVRNDGGTPETTWYQYDAAGQRVRKITELEAGPGAMAAKKNERIYVTGYELYIEHAGPNNGLERESLGLLDKGHRFLMIETRNGIDDGTDKKLVRYQLDNHTGSAAMELDGQAWVLSYEEYHPFGTTAYQAVNASLRAAAKRYRYTGMERDEESGLEYHGARYYLPWLGRWLSADPLGIAGGINTYSYASGNPIAMTDRKGTQARSADQDCTTELARNPAGSGTAPPATATPAAAADNVCEGDPQPATASSGVYQGAAGQDPRKFGLALGLQYSSLGPGGIPISLGLNYGLFKLGDWGGVEAVAGLSLQADNNGLITGSNLGPLGLHAWYGPDSGFTNVGLYVTGTPDVEGQSPTGVRARNYGLGTTFAVERLFGADRDQPLFVLGANLSAAYQHNATVSAIGSPDPSPPSADLVDTATVGATVNATLNLDYYRIDATHLSKTPRVTIFGEASYSHTGGTPVTPDGSTEPGPTAESHSALAGGGILYNVRMDEGRSVFTVGATGGARWEWDRVGPVTTPATGLYGGLIIGASWR